MPVVTRCALFFFEKWDRVSLSGASSVRLEDLAMGTYSSAHLRTTLPNTFLLIVLLSISQLTQAHDCLDIQVFPDDPNDVEFKSNVYRNFKKHLPIIQGTRRNEKGEIYRIEFNLDKERPKFKENWIIAVGQDRNLFPNGLLAKIDFVDPDRRWITLKNASLEDVIKKGKITIRVALCTNLEKGSGDSQPHVAMVSSMPELSCDTKSRGYRANASGKVVFEKGVDLHYQYGSLFILQQHYKFDKGKIVSAELTGEYCDDGSVGFYASKQFKQELDIWQKRLGPYTRFISWFPIVIGANVKTGLQAKSSAAVDWNPLFGYQNHLKGDRRYRRGKWSGGVKSGDLEFQVDSPPATKATLEVGLTPRLDIVLYGTLGPYLEGRLGAKGATELPVKLSAVSGTLETSLSVGIDYRIFSVKGEKLLDEKIFSAECFVGKNLKGYTQECKSPVPRHTSRSTALVTRYTVQ